MRPLKRLIVLLSLLALTACATATEKDLDRADELMAHGQYLKAIHVYRAVLKREPGQSQAQGALNKAQRLWLDQLRAQSLQAQQEQRVEEMIELARLAVDVLPQDAQAQSFARETVLYAKRQAEQWRAQSYFGDALSVYSALKEHLPQHAPLEPGLLAQLSEQWRAQLVERAGAARAAERYGVAYLFLRKASVLGAQSADERAAQEALTQIIARRRLYVELSPLNTAQGTDYVLSKLKSQAWPFGLRWGVAQGQLALHGQLGVSEMSCQDAKTIEPREHRLSDMRWVDNPEHISLSERERRLVQRTRAAQVHVDELGQALEQCQAQRHGRCQREEAAEISGRGNLTRLTEELISVRARLEETPREVQRDFGQAVMYDHITIERRCGVEVAGYVQDEQQQEPLTAPLSKHARDTTHIGIEQMSLQEDPLELPSAEELRLALYEEAFASAQQRLLGVLARRQQALFDMGMASGDEQLRLDALVLGYMLNPQRAQAQYQEKIIELSALPDALSLLQGQ